MRSLNVFYEGRMVGTLTEENNIWAFSYNEAWIGDQGSFDLSPALTRGQKTIRDGSSQRPVQWYFDNLLPEEALRQVHAKEADIEWEDAFGLLSYYGKESAGALTLLPPDTDNCLPTGLRALPLKELSRRIRDIPRVSLQHDAPKRMSLAGAQHKMLVVLDGENIFEPEAGTVSTHILKPNHPGDAFPASVINEYFTMRLAKAVGLEVPDVTMLYAPEPVYIVERFDRVREPSGMVRRLHVIDSCQLLNRDRVFKYRGADLSALNEVITLCRNKAVSRLHLFRWLVFNILVGNNDNHLKNISFIVDHEGTRPSPSYDLLATSVYETRALADERGKWPYLDLVFQLNPDRKAFGQITVSDLELAGQALGLTAKISKREIDNQLQSIIPAAAKLIDLIQSEHNERVERSPNPTEARKYWALEERVLHAIHHIILKDMHHQLAGS